MFEAKTEVVKYFFEAKTTYTSSRGIELYLEPKTRNDWTFILAPSDQIHGIYAVKEKVAYTFHVVYENK